MILQKDSLSEVIGIDQDHSTAMTIDDSDKNILMLILSQNLYSNPIGSIVREYSTNALDSHREAGIDEPIKVNLKREDGHFVFSVEDFGTGLSEDRVENIFSKYLASTKRSSTTQLGMYGIGSKSALSYVDSFNITSRYNGIQYEYLMFKGEEGTQLSLLDMFETVEPNGVKISIILKEDDDYTLFIENMKAQLCYFEGVFINDYYGEISSNYKIIKTKDWKYSELNEDEMLHLCLDNVYYPLDFSKLGIEPIKMPIGLVFSLNEGITPTPNRESFMYTPVVKELILQRIKDVGDFFIEKWNSIVPNVETFEEANKLQKGLYEVSIYSEETLDSNKNITVKIPKNLQKYCTKELKSVVLSLYSSLNLEQLNKTSSYILQEYQTVNKFKEGKYTAKVDGFMDIPNRYDTNIIFLDKGESLSKLQIQYLRWTEENYKIVRKHSHIKLGVTKNWNTSFNNYYGLLELGKHKKELVYNPETQKWECSWRKIIQEYNALIKSYVDNWQPLSSICPTEEFLTWRKEHREKTKRVKLGLEEIKVFKGRLPLNGRANKDVIYESLTLQIKDLDKNSNLYIYADEAREDALNKYINFLNYKIILCNTKSYKIIKKLNLHNWLNIDDVLVKRNKKISAIVTNIIKDAVIVLRDHNIYNTTLDIINNIEPKTGRLLNRLLSYRKNTKYREKTLPIQFNNQLIKLYVENKWFDYNIWDDIKTFYNAIPRLEFTQDVEGLYKGNPYYSKFIKLVWNDYKDKKQDKPFDEFLKELVTNLK